MANRNRAGGDGQASRLSNLKITTKHIDPDYDIEEHDLTRTDTGHLKVFSFTPKTAGKPSFQLRVDDGSAGKRRDPELDIDIEGVSATVKRQFKSGKGGYAGHHTMRSPIPNARIFEVKIKLPSTMVFDGEVFFNVDFSIGINMKSNSTLTAEMDVIRAKKEDENT